MTFSLLSFKNGEYIGIFVKIVCKRPKMPKLTCRQEIGLWYRVRINQLSLKISGTKIVKTHDIEQWSW